MRSIESKNNHVATTETPDGAALRVALDSNSSLRKLMVSCIDTALEELGSPEHKHSSSRDQTTLSASPAKEELGYNSASPSEATATPAPEECGPSSPAIDLGYGPVSPPGSPKLCLELQLRSRMRRSRYQRRNSVTKFSLEKVFQQVQKEDEKQQKERKPLPPQVWQRLYAKHGGHAMKRSSLDLYNNHSSSAISTATASVENPAHKQRRL